VQVLRQCLQRLDRLSPFAAEVFVLGSEAPDLLVKPLALSLGGLGPSRKVLVLSEKFGD
jgi:hypothetical protein